MPWTDPEKRRAHDRARKAARPKPIDRTREQETARARYQADPSKKKAADRRRRTPALNRDQACKRLYGMEHGTWEAMFEAQGRACAACGDKDPPSRRQWAVDHCHRTLKVRGILCMHCNVAIGMVDDDPDLLRKLAAYLEKP